MLSKRIYNYVPRGRTGARSVSNMIPSEHNKRIAEMRRNNERYLSIRSSEEFSKDTYLGILNGELIASDYSYNRVSMVLIEKYSKLNRMNDDKVHVIPSPIKVEHSSLENNLGSNINWREVAKPYHYELIEDGLCDPKFVKMRWVSESMSPYCTFAVSYSLDSHCFPMTFLVDTGSTRNYIKKSLFALINPELTTFNGEKVLFIHGKPFRFSLAPPGIPENVNIIGMSALLSIPKFAEAFSGSLHGKSTTPFEEGRIQFEDRIKE